MEAGINEMIFVTSSSKRAIEDHFDKNYELESELEKKGKKQLLEILRNIVPPNISCVYIRQSEALGLGHAVLCAKPVVGDEPFAVILADDLIDGYGTGVMKPIVEQYQQHLCNKLGYLQATTEYGLKHEELSGQFREYWASLNPGVE